MKLSYQWLSQYMDLPSDPRQLAQILTMAGIEVEGMETTGVVPDGVVVAEILARSPHPNAEKLSVCRVFDGTDELQIVCGAPNCDAGKRVPLAGIGTRLRDSASGKEIEIRKAKLRGIESSGMLCSARELGLNEQHQGLLELSANAPVGAALATLFVPDTMFEIEITPNRPDWLSHWGVARDLAALLRSAARFPLIPEILHFSEPATDTAGLVEVREPELCPRYVARLIRGVSVGESSEWLKVRLESIGLRPINNLVDITNFVLHELGHPLHAFDLDLLEGRKVVVRKALPGERIVALDGKEYRLASSQLVIADAARPVALAGIMGGEHSGVTEKTVDVLLESAVFQPQCVRATARALGISSDSSYRFERGVDYTMAMKASERATALILELAGGRVVGDVVDICGAEPVRDPVPCRFHRIRNLLGIDLAGDEMVRIFRDLGLRVEAVTADGCRVVPPTFRHDLQREADLAEEVARIHGLDKVPVRTPKAITGGGLRDDDYRPIQNVRAEMLALGLNEAVNLTLIDERAALLDPRFRIEDLVRLSNPLSLGLEFLRPSLLAGLLQNAYHNFARQNETVSLFEIGTVFCANRSRFPEERRELGLLISGLRNAERFSSERNAEVDYFDLKGILEEWFEHRNLGPVNFRKSDESSLFSTGKGIEIVVAEKPAGIAGELSSHLVRGLRNPHPVFVALLELDRIQEIHVEPPVYRAITPFPTVARDVAFLCDESLEHAKVVEFLSGLDVPNLARIELFDVFRDESIGSGRKSMAYSLTFSNSERTLTDKEVNAACDRLRAGLEGELGVTLR